MTNNGHFQYFTSLKMWKFCLSFSIVLQCFLSIQSQFVYQCNFDGFTAFQSCFDPLISPIEFYGSISNSSDMSGPLSDVTSIKTPTSNGEYCSLPYRLSGYRWDIYFCNRGSCETTSGSNGNCTKGQFGRTQYQLTNQFQSYLLKNLINRTTEIDGINEQCLIYYYYFPTTVQNELIIIKEEIDGNNITIDQVNSTFYNGWIERRVTFFAENSKYKIYFNIRKVSGISAPYGIFDEISIEQGNCTEPPSTTTTSSIVTNSEMTNPLTNPIITTEQTTNESPRTTSQTRPDSSITSTQSSTLVTTTTSTISPRSTMNTSTVIITTIRTTTVETSSSSMMTEKPFVTSMETFTETKPEEKEEDSPSNHLTIIIISVVVSVVVIVGAAGGSFLWFKRIQAKKFVSNFDQSSKNSNDQNHRESFLELNQMKGESSF